MLKIKYLFGVAIKLDNILFPSLCLSPVACLTVYSDLGLFAINGTAGNSFDCSQLFF